MRETSETRLNATRNNLMLVLTILSFLLFVILIIYFANEVDCRAKASELSSSVSNSISNALLIGVEKSFSVKFQKLCAENHALEFSRFSDEGSCGSYCRTKPPCYVVRYSNESYLSSSCVVGASKAEILLVDGNENRNSFSFSEGNYSATPIRGLSTVYIERVQEAK